MTAKDVLRDCGRLAIAELNATGYQAAEGTRIDCCPWCPPGALVFTGGQWERDEGAPS